MSVAVDSTRGPMLRALLRLAAPVVVMQACHTAFHLVNIMWVGRLGAEATAAVTTSFFALWTVYAIADIAAVGTTATVSRFIGARDRAAAGYGAAQGALLAVGIGVTTTVVGLLALPPLFALIGAAPRVQDLAVGYLRITLLGAVFSMLYVWAESTMRAAGDTRTPMIVVASCFALNALLDPLLIFGLGPVPALGVRGAAWATVLAQAVAVAWFGGLALRRHPAFPLDFAALRRFAPRYAVALGRIGLPYSLIGILFSAVYLYFAHVAAHFGTAAVAVVGVGNKIESVTYLVALGFGLACEAIVGQNLGAGRADRAARAAWMSAGLMAAFGSAVMLVMLLAPEALLSVFTSDPEVIRTGAPYVRILGLGQVFTGIELVLNGAFSGAGNTLPPMLISTSVSALRVPLAGWIAVTLGFGLPGLAWMISLTCLVRTAILASWFRRGAWRTKPLATAAA
ncbi:MAG: MATE family efflux transporter [Candidatus Eisenbacteria bacterium]